MKCCDKTFTNKKAFTNHVRWCSGKISYKSMTGYFGIHAWVRDRKLKPQFCEQCHQKPPMDLANISGNYLRDVSDYLYLCRSCHKIMDFTEATRAKLAANAKSRLRNERGNFL